MNSLKYINELIRKLSILQDNDFKSKVFVGFDGYIDKIQKAVETRSTDSVRYYKTLSKFSERIARAAGKSGQVELVTRETKIGGNAPIMANALGHLGVRCVCLGNGGLPQKNPLFKELHSNIDLLSIGDPAESNALEFNDGKLILSDLSAFRKIDWSHISQIFKPEQLLAKINECSVISLVGWCNPDHATDIWKGILENIMPHTPQKSLLFFDLADPTKKSRKDLMEVLDVINRFTAYGEVILGINENETLKLYEILSPETNQKDRGLEQKGKFIFSNMQIHGLLIHPVDRCLLIMKDESISLDGKVVREPVISTGGGDNLNAGFCTGRMLGLTMEESMILGMATSGAYVNYGKSPDFQKVISWLKSWE